MSRSLLVVVVALVLGGCSALQAGFGAYGETHAVPAGSKLILLKPLEIPAGQARVYLQGRVASSAGMGGVNQYETYCRLNVSNLGSAPVQPDTFIVTRYYQEAQDIGLSRRADFVQVAALGGVFIGAAGGQGDDGTAPLFFATVLDVHSDRQPNVRQLVCGSWADPWDGEYPTVTQIRRALGPYFELQRPTR